jgi:hypothetical protein
VKNSIFILMITLGLMPLSAQWQISATGQLSTGLEGQLNAATVNQGFLNGETNIAGFGSEFVWDKYGFEFETRFSFDQDPTLDWYTQWSTNLNFNYHPLGVDSFLDPFVGIGFGSSGMVNINQAERDHYGYTDYLNLSIHTHAQAGLAFALDNLYLGGKISYYPGQMPIPAAHIPAFDQEELSFTLFAGFVLGSRNFDCEPQEIVQEKEEGGLTITIDFIGDED